MLDQFDHARTAAATLINAHPDEIALMPSTEAGLAAVAAALRLEPGSNVVASDLDFTGTLLAWRSLERSRVGLKIVEHRDGCVDIADLEAAIDKRTRAVVLSSVQEVNGYRVDLADLSRMCRERDVLLIVDAIQHLGPLSLDVVSTPIDAIAVGGHKWLGAPFGMGFLYISASTAEELDPPIRSLMSAKEPPEGWINYLESPRRHPCDLSEFSTTARKLELGALGTTLAAAGLAAALNTLLEIGDQAIAGRSTELVEVTRSALTAVGAQIVTPVDVLPSSIVTFRSSGEIQDERELVDRLAAEQILVSLRFTTGIGGIRVSPYFYNDEADIERLADVVGLTISRRRTQRVTPAQVRGRQT